MNTTNKIDQNELIFIQQFTSIHFQYQKFQGPRDSSIQRDLSHQCYCKIFLQMHFHKQAVLASNNWLQCLNEIKSELA